MTQRSFVLVALVLCVVTGLGTAGLTGFTTRGGQVTSGGSNFSDRSTAVISTLETLVLANNTLVRGNYLAPNVVTPTAITIDSAGGLAIVAGSSIVGFINLASHQLVAGVSVGTIPDAIAYDTGRGEIFVANFGSGNISVISSSSEKVTRSIAVGTYPTSIVYDSKMGELFVANAGSNNVSVISDLSNKVVASVEVGAYPSAMVYDNKTGDIFVLNGNSDNVSVVSDSTDTVQSTISLGSVGYPLSAAYDYSNGEVYVSEDGTPGNVSVISDTTLRVVSKVTVGNGPDAIAYDPNRGVVFVANQNSFSISVISDRSNTVISNMSLGCYAYFALDSARGELWATSGSCVSGRNEVTVISDSSYSLVATITVGTTPHGLTFDTNTGEILTASQVTDSVSAVSSSTNKVLSSTEVIGGPYALAYDQAKREVFVTDFDFNEVSVLNDSSHTIVGTVSVDSEPTGIAYDGARGKLFVANDFSGTISIISDSTNTVLGTLTSGGSPRSLVYDGAKGKVYVTCDSYSNLVEAISDSNDRIVNFTQVGLTPTGIAYDSTNGEIYVANQNSNNVSVINDTTNSVVATIKVGINPEGVVFDNATKDILVANSGSNSVSVINTTTNNVAWTVPVGVGPWGLAYDSWNGDVYVTNVGSGTVSILVSQVPDAFPVNFEEVGLPTNANWSVTLSGNVKTGTGNISFSEPNGTYSFSVETIAGYSASPSSGSLTVNGAAVNISVTFTALPPGQYSLIFSETGLPTGANWSVTLNGSIKSSTTITIAFQEANGSYTFTVGSVSGYTVSPSSGKVKVTGGPASQSVTFTKSKQTTGLLGLPGYDGSIVVGVIVAVAAVAVFMLMRKRAPAKPTSASTSSKESEEEKKMPGKDRGKEETSPEKDA